MELTQRDNSGLGWLTQAVSGLVLVLQLLLHMVAHHFVVEGGLRTYKDVKKYVSNPFVSVIELSFLFMATVHAILGVRAIILDLSLSRRAEQTVTWIMSGLGVFTVIYGFWLWLVCRRQ